MDQENIPSKAKRGFSNRDMAVIQKTDEEQKQLYAFINKHSQFSEEEKYALQIDSVPAFIKQWNLAIDSRGKFEASHEHGVRLTARRAQQFAESAYDVLQHKNPIVQLVQDFGAPYGGMAIGVISFLFTVIRNRAKLEASIYDTLLQIRDRTAGLEVFRHIYDDDHELDQQLQSKIVQAYKSFMSFCIEATRFYSSGSMRRWLRSTWSFSHSLEDRASEVQRSLVDVRYTSEELLSKNVDRIKQINLDQMEEIKRLQEQIEKLQIGRDNDRLLAIQKLLHLEIYSQEYEWELLQRYHRNTDAYFDQQCSLLEVMKGSRLEAFKNNPKIRQWQYSEHSCTLILAGYNHDIYSGMCWLSPFALDTIKNLRGSHDNKVYAFYILGQRDHDSFSQVLWCILFQLLRQTNEALQDDTQYAELHAEIQKYQKATETGGSKHTLHDYSDVADTLLRKAAVRILKMVNQNKTVWIILDRVDQCKSSTKAKHQKRLIKALVYLLENTTIRIRILAIVNGYDWKVEEQHDEFGASNQSSVIVDTYKQRLI
ncbi:hypothetical protein V8C40DRAFT_247949, partial [Trichoderma camerunense]